MAPQAAPQPAHQEHTLTTAQAAEQLGVSSARIRQFIREGRLPAHKVGRDNLIKESDLDPLRHRQPGRPWPSRQLGPASAV